MVINPSSFIHPAAEAPTELSRGSCQSGAPPGALTSKTSPLSVPPFRSGGSVRRWFFRVHWVKPKLVAEITYLTWTDGLLRHTVYVGLREDKPATDVRRESAEINGRRN